MEEKKKTKYFQYMSGGSVRAIIDKANELGLTKEDFISLNKSEGEFLLIYYK